MIADVVSYGIAGIGFIHAVGRSFVPKRFHTQHEHCYDARLPRNSAPLALRFSLSSGCLRQAAKVHSARTRVEGLMRSVKALKRHRQASTPAGWKLMTLGIALRIDGRGPRTRPA